MNEAGEANAAKATSEPALRLGIVDQSPVSDGGTPREALLATLDLARAADRLGYSRYWVTEHHNTQMLASASPELLIPLIASSTSRIRVGSGGVMLPHYSSLKVAEVFRLLETLFPGRIDMGFGRAPGSDQLTAAAMKHGPGALPLAAYPEQVRDVLRFMTDAVPEGHPFHGVRAIPTGDSLPLPWLLGSAYDSAQFAAEQGLPFSFAHFISPDGGPQVVRAYRDHFQPSAILAQPLVNVGVAAVCAETDDEAHRIGLSRHLMRLRRAQGRGRGGGVPSIEEALATEFTEPEQDYINYQQSLAFEGGPERVARGLREVAAEYGVDELLIVTITHDYGDRLRSYELIAEALGLPQADAANEV